MANTDAGPDFIGAFLSFDRDPPHRGDVELHLEATSWERHGHQHDARYDGVILHVVLLDDGGPAFTHRGLPIPLLALGPVLARRAAGDTPRERAAPCYRPAGASRPTRAVVEALRHAGMARFDRRVVTWQALLQSKPVEDCALLALLQCAGLGKNAGPCAALAAAVGGATLDALMAAKGPRAEAVATAVLLGMSGLLESANVDAEIRELWHAYRDCWPGRPLPRGSWRRFRVRPSNLPEVRLRYAAALAARAGLGNLIADTAGAVDVEPPPTCGRLLSLLGTDRRLPGRSWGLESLTNTILPLVAAWALNTQNARLAARAERAYSGLPGGGQNAVLERMVRLTGIGATPRTAIEQQGLLHVWNSHCSARRCETCPLAAL